MTAPELIASAEDALVTVFLVSAPLMIVATITGVLVSLFQALTQIQEQTMIYVPKIVATFLTLVTVIPPGPTSTWAKELVGENDNSAAKARGVRKRFVLTIDRPYRLRVAREAGRQGTLKKKLDRSSNRAYIPFMPFILL